MDSNSTSHKPYLNIFVLTLNKWNFCLFLPFPSGESRMRCKLEGERKIRHYEIFNIAPEISSSFHVTRMQTFFFFFPIFPFAGSFLGQRPVDSKETYYNMKYNLFQVLGETIIYYNGTTGMCSSR